MTTSVINPLSNIFAVDSDIDDLDLLRLLLRKAGLPNPVRIFREGEALVAALGELLQRGVNAARPLLCFLDLNLPRMGGHEALRWIRGRPELERMSVVVLSSSEHPRDIQTAAQDGAQCYLAKYPQPRLLREVANEAVCYAQGAPAEECFCMPANLLLVRCRRLVDAPPAKQPLLYPPPRQRTSGHVA